MRPKGYRLLKQLKLQFINVKKKKIFANHSNT
jgi:hypothetical protein